MRRSLLLDVTTRGVTAATMVLAIYLLTAGHNQPGGGFIGGLVGGAAVAIAYVGGGLEQVRAMTRLRPWTILGAGLAIGALAAAIPLVIGGEVLEQGFTTLEPPLIGTVKVTSALFFDTGVFLVVVGTVLMAFEALGEEGRPLDADDAEPPGASSKDRR